MSSTALCGFLLLLSALSYQLTELRCTGGKEVGTKFGSFHSESLTEITASFQSKPVCWLRAW